MAMERRCGISDEALACVLEHIESPVDRAAISLVCHQWRRVDGETRTVLTIANMYAAHPTTLTRRFHRLEQIKLKGMPRAAEYGLLQRDWGGSATPWLRELARHYLDLRVLQLRRVSLRDADLALVAASGFGAALHVLHLHKCVGFSTKGLVPVASKCRSLKRLSLDESDVQDSGGAWLHTLAHHNTTLEELHFGILGIEDVNLADLLTLVERCKSLVCLKVGEVDMRDLSSVLRRAPAGLRELGAGSCGRLGEEPVSLPGGLRALTGMWNLPDVGVRMVLPVVGSLRKLDLQYTLLSCEGHCSILSSCHLLEELKTRNTLGDEGMETLAGSCKLLRKLRVDHDETGELTQRGVFALAQGCPLLDHLVLYVSNICNAALAMVGQGCPLLTDFRIILESNPRHRPDFPLDDGLKLLLKSCVHLTRMAVYLRHGGLTDRGLVEIGSYGGNLKWLLLGCVGESDVGLAGLAYGCERMERLEIRDCPFGEAGLAVVVEEMRVLKVLWVQGYREGGGGFETLVRPFFNVEVYPSASVQQPGQLFAYYTLAGPRKDGPRKMKTFAGPDSAGELS